MVFGLYLCLGFCMYLCLGFCLYLCLGFGFSDGRLLLQRGLRWHGVHVHSQHGVLGHCSAEGIQQQEVHLPRHPQSIPQGPRGERTSRGRGKKLTPFSD